MGYIPFEREATDLLYEVISRRYERASIGLTANLAFTELTRGFLDTQAASAVVDRLVHHDALFEFASGSHRLRSRQAAGRAARSKLPSRRISLIVPVGSG
ncbi:MAG: ATP-binding protein [Vulcanimicrobiaceae bacterium]